MKTAFLGSFLRDVKKIRNADLREAIADAITDVEDADSAQDIRQLTVERLPHILQDTGRRLPDRAADRVGSSDFCSLSTSPRDLPLLPVKVVVKD